MVQLLLSNSPNIEIKDSMGWTALMVACMSPFCTCIELMEGASGHQEVVTELLNAGADPKTTNEKEQTPLYVSARPYRSDQS
jgi:ankyrin repeat protein